MLFLDNLNNAAFSSDLLASVITERPARVRVLGRSQMVQLNASAFVILTGNGLTVSEDLARRFIMRSTSIHAPRTRRRGHSRPTCSRRWWSGARSCSLRS